MKVGDIVTVKGIVSNIIPGYESNRIEINECLVVSENQIVEVIPISHVNTEIKSDVIEKEVENVQTENTNPEHSSEDHIEQQEHKSEE